MSEVVEQVRFRAVPGVASEEVLAEMKACQAWLERQPGFVSRWLVAPEEGEWLDLVRWRSAGDAHAAATAAMADPAFLAHMRVIEASSVVMAHRTLAWSA